MARFLAYTSPARGHAFPIAPTLLELRRRGHEVAVRTISAAVEPLRAANLEAEPVALAIERREIEDWRARTPLGAQKRAFAGWMERAEHELADLPDAIERHRPDALIVDTNAWGACAVAEASPLPAIRFHAYPLPMAAEGVPPFGPGLAPARGALGRLRDRALTPLLMRPLASFVLPQLNPIRERAGAPPLDSMLDVFGPPLPLLHLAAEPFEYPRQWPDHVHPVGPGVWDPPLDDDARELLDWIDGRGRPLALISTSSEFQHDGRLVACALEALAGEDLTVVATVAANDPSRAAVPANARVLRYAPHRPLLERAAVVVCHAGMGITQKALARGVPVCAAPFGRDQLEVARRVTVAGAGTRVSARRVRPGQLRAAVRQAMTMRAGAERVAAGFAAAGGPERAADLAEALLPVREPVAS